MKYLLDTHLLLWVASQPKKLSRTARALVSDPDNELFFSSASIWEIVVKSGLGRDDFSVDATILRRSLVDNGYGELPITSDHVLGLERLAPIHKDPFDRILLAQATGEGIMLLTADEKLARYPGPIRKV